MDSTQTPRPFNLDYEYATAALHRERRMHRITCAVLIAASIACGFMIALVSHLRAENKELRTRVEGDAMYHRATSAFDVSLLTSFCASLDGNGMVCWRSE